MNRFQREVASLTLEQEKKVLKEIKSEYEKAVSEINDKVAQLIGRLQNEPENASSIIYQLNYQSAIRGQIGAILDNLKANNFTSIQDYLKTCYEDGFVGTFYDLQKQGLPIIFPIDQEQMVRAIVHDTKLSENLYNKLGQDVNDLKKNISSTISRGISTNDSYSNISRNIRIVGDTYSNKAYRIARTEGHRITQEATHDAQMNAKDAGADIVKQWDAALDSKTRPAHRALDGQIKEIDEAFEYGGHKAMYPGGFGVGGLDINCRCVIIQRAKWAIDDEDDNFTKWDGVNKELLNLKSKNYEQFKKSYQKMVDDNNSLNDVTNRLLEKAKKAETGITKDLQEIIGSTNGTIDYDVGNGKTALDFKLKGGGSLKRKITSDFVTGVDLDDIEKSIYDNVRYTDLVDKDLLVDDYVKIQKQLEDKGYKIVRVKNTFDNPNSAYRGLNTVVEDPNGYKFELQFHTPESIEIKEKVHVLYEQFRLDSTSTAEKIRLNNEMLKISQSLPDIKNASAIKNYNMLKGESPIPVVFNERAKLTLDNLPSYFTTSTANKKKFQEFVNTINNAENANPRVVELYSKLGEMENVDRNGILTKLKFSSNGNAVSQKWRSLSGELVEVNISLNPDNVSTNIHELAHLIDVYNRPNSRLYGSFTSEYLDDFVKVLKESGSGMGEEINDIFKNVKNSYKDIQTKYVEMFRKEVKEMGVSYIPKLQKKYHTLIEKAMRDVGTGGLEDIYDALSGGQYQNNGTVKFGHGPKYYAYTENKISEIFANYCELSITSPDLIEALKRDKPKLVEYLDSIIDKMLKGR